MEMFVFGVVVLVVDVFIMVFFGYLFFIIELCLVFVVMGVVLFFVFVVIVFCYKVCEVFCEVCVKIVWINMYL